MCSSDLVQIARKLQYRLAVQPGNDFQFELTFVRITKLGDAAPVSSLRECVFWLVLMLLHLRPVSP